MSAAPPRNIPAPNNDAKKKKSGKRKKKRKKKTRFGGMGRDNDDDDMALATSKIFHCEIEGCPFRAATFAHLSLHCALSHFRSEQPPSVKVQPSHDLIDFRAPEDTARLRMLRRKVRVQKFEDQRRGGAGGSIRSSHPYADTMRARIAEEEGEEFDDSTGGVSTAGYSAAEEQRVGTAAAKARARFRPVLLDPVFPPVQPPGEVPIMTSTTPRAFPVVEDYVEHRQELFGHEVSIFSQAGPKQEAERRRRPSGNFDKKITDD